MRNVDLDSSLIRRLFRARQSSSGSPPLTERERRAADTVADSEESICLASLNAPIPVHIDVQEWNKNRRRNFDWEELCDLADFHPDGSLAESSGVVATKFT